MNECMLNMQADRLDTCQLKEQQSPLSVRIHLHRRSQEINFKLIFKGLTKQCKYILLGTQYGFNLLTLNEFTSISLCNLDKFSWFVFFLSADISPEISRCDGSLLPLEKLGLKILRTELDVSIENLIVYVRNKIRRCFGMKNLKQKISSFNKIWIWKD